MIPIDIRGKKFGRLMVVKYDESSRGRGHAYWICRCECGTVKSVKAAHLKSKNVTSCGCRSKEVSRKLLTTYANSRRHKGAGNPMWKGERTKYPSIHSWLVKNYTKNKCEVCGSKKNLDWALKRGKKHAHDRKNYRVLCRKHHIRYDKKRG